MSGFLAAYRAWRESEERCPKCDASNIPGAKKTIEIDEYGRGTCATCGHDWTVTK